jgi:hypothetical protein
MQARLSASCGSRRTAAGGVLMTTIAKHGAANTAWTSSAPIVDGNQHNDGLSRYTSADNVYCRAFIDFDEPQGGYRFLT